MHTCICLCAFFLLIAASLQHGSGDFSAKAPEYENDHNDDDGYGYDGTDGTHNDNDDCVYVVVCWVLKCM